jgi:hypothetical protein
MKRLPIDSNTLIAVIGLAALAAGLALVSLPLALVVVGALFIVYAVLPDRGGAS